MVNGSCLLSAWATRRVLGQSHEGVAQRDTQAKWHETKSLPSPSLIHAQSKVLQKGATWVRRRQENRDRKHHMAVDTMGFTLAVAVHSAGIQDRVGVRAVLIRLFGLIHGVQKIFADDGYGGQWVTQATVMLAMTVEVIKRDPMSPISWCCQSAGLPGGPSPRLALSRRLNRDDEIGFRPSEYCSSPLPAFLKQIQRHESPFQAAFFLKRSFLRLVLNKKAFISA